MLAPKTFTKENIIEINCHGGISTTNKVLELLLLSGARLAEPGEFTKRAFLNGRIDLTQAEGIMNLIESKTDISRQMSINQLSGKASNLIINLRKELVNIISNIEVNIDYPEYEDIEVVTIDKIISEGNKMHQYILKLIKEGQEGEKIKEGINVAIVGKPNVGKSSLLNALLKEDKAIVTDIAGTTRDIVEGDVTLKGITFHMFDTAGIHESSDVVESIGISKAKKTIDQADLVLLLLDASKKLDKDDQELIDQTKDKNVIIVHNKSDISSSAKGISISAKKGDVDSLVNEMLNRVGVSNESFLRPSLNNSRQIGLLKKANIEILKAIEDAKNGLPVDLISVSLTNAYNSIQAILGNETNVDISKEIFARFCVGK